MYDNFNQERYVALRPLSRGVNLEDPSHLLAVGEFTDLKNVHVRRGGLERRGGYSPFGTVLPSVDNRVYGGPLFYDQVGNPEPLLVTKKHLWKLTTGNKLELLSKVLYSGRTASTVAESAEESYWTVTDSVLLDFLSGGIVLPGDTLWIGGTTTGTPYTIRDVNSDGTIVIYDHDGSIVAGTSVAYDLVEGFRRIPDWTLLRDYATGNRYFVWTDNSGRGLMAYDGSNVTELNDEQDPVITSIDTVTFFGYRLWVAGITENATNERARIRWTTVTDQTTFPVSQYVDLPAGRSGVWRLLPLGNLLVAYMRDKIYFGRPTNIVNLPYDFTPYDTGNVGLVGPRAITSWLDAHWFVGQDDIYSFSASRALERIGTSVLKETIRNPDVDLEKTIVVPDPENERIVFLFFTGGSAAQVEKIWSYYYKTQTSDHPGAWSSEPFGGFGYFYSRTVNGQTWSDAAGDWDATTWLNPWYQFKPVASPETTFALRGTQLYSYSKDQKTDVASGGSTPVAVDIESPDFDFDSPNVVKAVTQLSVKLERDATDDVLFEVLVSNNRMTTWKNVGTLKIEAGQDEGKVDFRMSGSLFRFKLSTSSTAQPWIINEVVLAARQTGREFVFV